MNPRSHDIPAERLLAESAWVRRLARRLVGDAHLADDLSQEALAAALERGGNGRSSPRVRDLRPWLHGVVHKLRSLDRRSALRRDRRERNAARPEVSSSSPEETLRRAERIQRIGSAVLELDEPYRSTILLRFLEELPVEKVATRMQVAPSTVRVRTKRALAKLHGRLFAEWGDDRGTYSLALVSLAGAPALAQASAASVGKAAQTLALVTGMKLQLKVLTALVLILASGGVWLATHDRANETVPVEGENALAHGLSAADDRGDLDAPGEGQGDAQAALSIGGARRAANPTAVAPRERALVAPARSSFGDTTLSGRVVDGDGDPVAGARIAVFPQKFQGVRRLGSAGVVDPIGSVLSAPDGSFRFEELTDFAEYGLRAAAEGFVTNYENSEPGDGVELVLRPAVRLWGHVLEHDGTTPVVDALLTSQGDVENLTCRTGADGSYEFPSFEGGARFKFEVFVAGRVPTEVRGQLAARGETRHDVELPRPATFSGRVVDAMSWQPVPHATIYGGWSGQHVATADEQGRFQVDVEAAMLQRERNQAIEIAKLGGSLTGAYLGENLRAEAPGYTPTSAPLWAPLPDSGLEFALPVSRASRIEGRVTHPDGRPAVGVVVGWEDRPLRFLDAGAMAIPGPDSERVRTDDDGSFELPSVPWSPSFGGVLELRLGSHPPVIVGDACPTGAGETRRLELVLEGGSGLRGRVLVNGTPEHAYVYLDVAGDGAARDFETDEQGRFSFQGLEPGTHVLRACTGDGSAVYSEDHTFVFPLPAGELAEIHIDTRFDIVSGRVVDTTGEPLADVGVMAFPQRSEGTAGRGNLLAGHTDTIGDGTFRIRLEPSDEVDPFFTISAFHGGALYETIDVQAGRDDLEYVLPPLRWVQLVLSRNETGEPVPTARLAWRDESTGLYATLYGGIEMPATSQGVFRVELPIGSIELEISAPSLDIPVRKRKVTVGAGGPEPEIDVGL